MNVLGLVRAHSGKLTDTAYYKDLCMLVHVQYSHFIIKSQNVPPQPIRTCRSPTALCRSSDACPRPHRAGERTGPPFGMSAPSCSARHQPRWNATTPGPKPLNVSRHRAGALVGAVQSLEAPSDRGFMIGCATQQRHLALRLRHGHGDDGQGTGEEREKLQALRRGWASAFYKYGRAADHTRIDSMLLCSRAGVIRSSGCCVTPSDAPASTPPVCNGAR